MTETTRQLTQERRARLLAERKLSTRQGDMRKNISEMERRASNLTEAILEKRAQLDRLQDDLHRQQRETEAAQALVTSAEDARDQSESRLWLALETVRDGFAMYDAEGRLTCANRAFRSIFDDLEEVAPGIAYDRLCEILLEEGVVDPRMPPADWLEEMRQRWQQEVIPDKTICLWNGQFVKLVDRRIDGGGIVALGLDQTYERRITSAIETIPDGFVVYDRDDNLVMCNQRYRDLLPGVGDLIKPGANLQDILRAGVECGAFPDAADREEAWIEEQMRLHHFPPDTATEHSVTGGRWIRSVDAETPDGGRAGLRADITKSKRIEVELRDARAAAEAASRAKSRFLTNMNHEFRTPLNGIIGLTSILHDRIGDTEDQVLVRSVQSSAEALLGIIEHVLETISHDQHYAVAAGEPFDLTDTLTHVTKLLSSKMRLAEMDFTLEIADDLPTAYLGDDPRLRQVLANLLGNACKFAPGKTVALRVDGRPRDGADDAAPVWDLDITVEDTGPGIPEGTSDRIFRRFTQADGAQSRQHDGIGLGLSLSRSVADLMGGELWHDPDWTQGARFRLSLPVRQRRLPTLAAASEPCVLIREDTTLGELLAIRLRGFGLRIEERQVKDLSRDGDADVTTIVQASAISGDFDAFLDRICKGSAGKVVVLGPLGADVTRDLKGLVVLPQEAPSWDDIAEAFGHGRANAAGEAPAPGPVRVLAAEDNRTNQMVLRRMLEPLDCDLTLVSSGAEAIEAVKQSPPDLVFMDISMPGMDGKVATAHIRDWLKETGAPHLPIYALTAHATSHDRRAILAAGLDDVMTKPIDRKALARTIADIQAARTKAGASGSDNSSEKT